MSRIGLVAGIALLAVAPMSAACSDDGSESGHAEVINAILALDGAGLHTIDESLNTKGEVPATARTTALKMQSIALLTDWPEKLDSQGKAVADALGALAKSLEGDKPDVKAAGAAARKVHDVEHDFSSAVWAYLQEEAGVSAGGSGGHE